ncbi:MULTISPECIES: hypothetical protein, partial [unclassified Bradyrhizobium]|uniref:hypothetical protein n=1 Tax=unclassified Bradyrhizobium TaxID=2631580 RepID=UPI0028E42F06
ERFVCHPLFESRRIPTLKHKLNAYAVFPAPLLQGEEGTIEQSSGASRREIARSRLGCLVNWLSDKLDQSTKRRPSQALAAWSLMTVKKASP